jgi:putative membrane-bound dehydrogenase-like protein
VGRASTKETIGLAIFRSLVWAAGLALAVSGAGANEPVSANRLRHLDAVDPYYPNLQLAKLTTPQWVGEPGVDVVVVLAIDDMRGHEKWEAYLRPILDRLKQRLGRAPLSIMTCQIDPQEKHLQQWLREGVSLETHTFDHPCPLLKEGSLPQAKATYDRCVDQMAAIPGSRPVAFRMPCCDSLNTLSPRFFSEIFGARTPERNFLELDSSVFCLLTANDPELPRELVLRDDGTERFRRYVPFPSFVNTIEDYPYPFVIGGNCWEFPCIVPSDWSAQHVQKPANPETVRDLQLALDAVVQKQGVFNLVFHPYDWLRSDQIVQLIDHSLDRYGSRVKFLSFREARDRLTENLLEGQSLRGADGSDNGVRVLDLNHDGFQDVVIGNDSLRQTRVWDPAQKSWQVSESPWTTATKSQPAGQGSAVRFGILDPDGSACVWSTAGAQRTAWRFQANQWVANDSLWQGLELDGAPLDLVLDGVDQGVRFIDLDADGCCECLAGHPDRRGVFLWDRAQRRWNQAPFSFPEGVSLVDAQGGDAGLRLVDIDDDLDLDLLFSNELRSAVYLFENSETGWSRQVHDLARGDERCLPMIARAGTNNGAWFHSRQLWVQNEDTARLPDLVERRSFQSMLEGVEPQAKSPRAALSGLVVRPGMRVDLMASEPQTTDPVGMDWGADGRLWLVEMHDYPLGVDGRGKPGGRVRVLEDADGDGHYERSDLFADDLPFPTGILSWRDGVLVTAAPDILYLADTDGDRKADVREVLYTGFSLGNQQHRINGFERGLDNWIYCANGHSGGRVRSLKTGAEVDIGGRDLRIRPATGELEAISGVSQFQRSHDDWGNWIGNSNAEPSYQFVLDDHYLSRNPHVAPLSGISLIPELPGTAPIFAKSRTLARFNDFHTADRFTSACSTIVYRDELLCAPFIGNSFVSEPVHNLVHREVPTQGGLLLHTQRASDEQTSEFLASTDNWFRPTALRTGPDGGLWIADMYRAVIEHPEWIPTARHKELDVRGGSDMGRIYRVLPVGTPPRAWPRLDKLATPELVAQLESPNGWIRDKVQELLVARNDPAALVPLKQLATQGQRPTARLHALCTLDGLRAMDPDTAIAAMKDPHPEVRRHAARVSEPLLADHPEVGETLTQLANDAAPQVLLQVAYSLGAWNDPRAGKALGAFLTTHSDPYLLAAGMSSIVPQLPAVVQAVAASSPVELPLTLATGLMDTALGTDQVSALAPLAERIARVGTGDRHAPWQIAALAHLLEGLQSRQLTFDDLLANAPQAANTKQALDRLARFANQVARDPQADEADRLAAIGLLGRNETQFADDLTSLCDLLGPQHPAALQSAALSTLEQLKQDEVAAQVLAGWKSYAPALRRDVLDLLFRRDAWLPACLTALENGTIAPREIDTSRQQRLLRHRNAEIRERAAQVLSHATEGDRARVVEDYRAVTNLSADATHGQQVFSQKCGICHRFNSQGHAVGPDLSALTDRSPAGLLVSILDPNRAVESKYQSYAAVTDDGLTYTGLLSAESGSSVTLLAQEGKQQVILRNQLEALESTGKSLMPEGLERELSRQDLADVLAYLGSGGPKPKTFAGNRPELVTQEALRGELFCLSTNGEIYGDTLVLEAENTNLGFWGSESDHVTWEVEVKRKTRFAVILEWACDDSAAGNTYLLEVADQRLTGQVKGTGGWNSYHRETVGHVELKPGRYRLGLRSSGPIQGYLFDFKSVTLRPGFGG